jgi:hypothetical protein
MDGVSVVFVAVACGVPAVSVANTVGEPVKSTCAGSIGVPSPTGAQAAANRVTVSAPNRNMREILFIVFSFSGQGRLLLLGEPISLQKPSGISNQTRIFKFGFSYISCTDIERFIVLPAVYPCH